MLIRRLAKAGADLAAGEHRAPVGTGFRTTVTDMADADEREREERLRLKRLKSSRGL
jgi:hypothetical protein